MPSTPSTAAVREREPVGGRRDHPAPLLPRVARDDEQHPVEAELARVLGGDDHVADVHGIERAPEHAQPLLIGGSLRAPRVFTLRETFASSVPVASVG